MECWDRLALLPVGDGVVEIISTLVQWAVRIGVVFAITIR